MVGTVLVLVPVGDEMLVTVEVVALVLAIIVVYLDEVVVVLSIELDARELEVVDAVLVLAAVEGEVVILVEVIGPPSCLWTSTLMNLGLCWLCCLTKSRWWTLCCCWC